MKIVALEKHFATAEVLQGWKSIDPRWSDLALFCLRLALWRSRFALRAQRAGLGRY
jgi:hypothetical protein